MGILKLSVGIFNGHCSGFYRRNLIQSGVYWRIEFKDIFLYFLPESEPYLALPCLAMPCLALPWLAFQYLSFSVPRVLRSPSFSYTLFSFIYLFWSFCLVSAFVKLSLSVTWFHVILFCSSLCSPSFLPSLALLISLVSPPGSFGLAVIQCINGIETYPDV